MQPVSDGRDSAPEFRPYGKTRLHREKMDNTSQIWAKCEYLVVALSSLIVELKRLRHDPQHLLRLPRILMFVLPCISLLSGVHRQPLQPVYFLLALCIGKLVTVTH